MSSSSSSSSANCTFCNIDTIMLSIIDCAQTNADQLDFHRALQLEQQEQEQENSISEHEKYIRRRESQMKFYNQDRYYARAKKIATILLNKFVGGLFNTNNDKSSTAVSGSEDGAEEQKQKQSSSSSCKGLLNIQCLKHIMTIAACFAACKFEGTKDIMFVTLDNLVISLLNIQNNNPQTQSSLATSYQDEIVLTKKADPKKKINLFEDSDEEQQQTQTQQPIPSSDDDLIVDKQQQNSSSQEDSLANRELLVDAIIMAEKELMKRCLYFGAFPMSEV